MKEHGLKWCNGRDYIESNLERCRNKNKIYYSNQGSYGDLENYIYTGNQRNYIVLEFSDYTF